MLKVKMFGTAALAAAGLTMVAAMPAQAAPYNGPCSVTLTSCTTGDLQAGPSHSVTVDVLTTAGGGNFQVVDRANGHVVWSRGFGNFTHWTQTIPTLYSAYYCTVRNAGPGAGCALITD